MVSIPPIVNLGMVGPVASMNGDIHEIYSINEHDINQEIPTGWKYLDELCCDPRVVTSLE